MGRSDWLKLLRFIGSREPPITTKIVQGHCGWSASFNPYMQFGGRREDNIEKVPEGSEEQRKIEEAGCEVFYGAPMILAVKG